MEIFEHIQLRSYCLQVQPITCSHPSIFLYEFGVCSINSKSNEVFVFYKFRWQPTKDKRLWRVFIKRTLKPTLELVHVMNGLSTSNSNSSNANNKVATARLLWKDKWLQDYDWSLLIIVVRCWHHYILLLYVDIFFACCWMCMFFVDIICYIGKSAYLSMPKFLAGCHYNEEEISRHL